MSDIIETPLTETFLDQVVARPERFLLEDAQLPTELLHNTRDCFASGKSLEFYELGVLEGLHVKDFPDEQIWEQLQLRNQPVLRTFSRKLGRLMNWMEELADESEKEDDDGESTISQGPLAEEVTSEVGSTTSDEIGQDGVSDSDQAEWAGLEDGESSVSDVEALDSASDQEESGGFDDESVDDQEDDESDAAEGSVDEPVVKKYEVDDDFFQLDAMEKYVNAAEEEEEKEHELRRALQRGKIPADLNEDGDDDDSDEEIDYFQDLNGPMGFGLGNEEGDDDQGDPNIMYDEFFGSQKKLQRQARPRQEPLKVSFENDHTGDESESDDSDADTLRASKPRSLFDEDDGSAGEKGRQEELSRFEQQQQRLKKRIEQLEAENVGLRDWRMVGEVSARDRPENSLLEQDLEFDHASKPIPVITAEVTESLEDMIKRRILDNQFNDVERKRDPALDQKKPREQVELDQKQSKKSLAEIYEAEYQEQVQEEKGERVLSEREQKLERERQEVLSKVQRVHHKLDALTNFHFTPKAKQLVMTVISDTSAGQREEITPHNVSTASQMAPEEIHKKQNQELKGKTELSKADKRRNLLAKKEAIRKRTEKQKKVGEITSKTIAENTF